MHPSLFVTSLKAPLVSSRFLDILTALTYHPEDFRYPRLQRRNNTKRPAQQVKTETHAHPVYPPVNSDPNIRPKSIQKRRKHPKIVIYPFPSGVSPPPAPIERSTFTLCSDGTSTSHKPLSVDLNHHLLSGRRRLPLPTGCVLWGGRDALFVDASFEVIPTVLPLVAGNWC
jgi:hypothetical protein